MCIAYKQATPDFGATVMLYLPIAVDTVKCDDTQITNMTNILELTTNDSLRLV